MVRRVFGTCSGCAEWQCR